MNIIGNSLAVLLLLTTLNSTHYFLRVAKAKPIEWIVFNACAPANIAYLIGFLIFLITQDRTVLHAAVLPIVFFGGLGLFLFPWSGFNLIAQISHIIMVLNVVWLLWGTFAGDDYQSAFLGLLIGLVIFSPFINYQQMYSSTHPEAAQKLLGVSSAEFQKKYEIRNRQSSPNES